MLRGRRAGVIYDTDNEDVMRGALVGLLLRRWGMTAQKANARLLLDRLAHVGRGSAAAAHRREEARHTLRLASGPRLWRCRIV